MRHLNACYVLLICASVLSAQGTVFPPPHGGSGGGNISGSVAAVAGACITGSGTSDDITSSQCIGSSQLSDFAATLSNGNHTLNVAGGTYNGLPTAGATFTFVTMPVISTDSGNPGVIEVADTSALGGGQNVLFEGAMGCDALNGLIAVGPVDGTHATVEADLSACGTYTSGSAVGGLTDMLHDNMTVEVVEGLILLSGNDGAIFSLTGNAFYLGSFSDSSPPVLTIAVNTDNTWGAIVATPSFLRDSGGGGGSAGGSGCVQVSDGGGGFSCPSTMVFDSSLGLTLENSGGTLAITSPATGLTFGNVQIGVNDAALDDAGVVIGYTNQAGHSGIAIGVANFAGTASIGAGTGRDVAIGESNTIVGQASGAFGQNLTVTGDESYAIGNQISITGNSDLCIGDGVTCTGSQQFCLGWDSTCSDDYAVGLGPHATAAFYNSLAIGAYSLTTARNQIVFGDSISGAPLEHYYFNGVIAGSGREEDIDFNINAASPGTDLPGKDWYFNGGQGRGSGAGGNIIFSTAPATMSGSDLNPQVQQLIIASDGVNIPGSSFQFNGMTCSIMAGAITCI